MLKTISCGDVRTEHIGKTVTLAGWVNRRRDHGNLIFIDLRDREGLVQVVFNPEQAAEAHNAAEQLRNEWVIQVIGEVTKRPEGSENPNLATGDVEVVISQLTVLNESKTPPFYINEESDVDEFIRLKYRYMDLRRPAMRDMLIMRHKLVKFTRDYLDERGFLEIETPILIKSTPEGARDYLVPSRLYPGRFYALPQSPQQLKQLLMAAGVERYYQIAKCFRDEDPRADRQPEFTQLDLEMSFVEEDDVLNLTEELYTKLIETLFPDKWIIKPFPRLTYAESIALYGTDKPDMRFDLDMADLSDIAAKTEFRVFTSAVENGGIVKGFNAPGCASYPRRQTDALIDFVKARGAQGLVTISLMGDGDLDDLTHEQIRSGASRFLTVEQVKEIASRLDAEPGDMILIVAGPAKSTNNALGLLRHEMGKRLELADPNQVALAFITDFPLFEYNEDDGTWDAMHHAFSMPKDGHEQYLGSDPGRVLGKLYDLVANGSEVASGSIRIHTRDLQERVFQVLGYSKEQVAERFDQLLTAFEYGTPPHGGIAPGIDRLLMVLMDKDNIRDVIAFPKTQSGFDPLFEAPNYVEPLQLEDLHVQITADEEEQQQGDPSLTEGNAPAE